MDKITIRKIFDDYEEPKDFYNILEAMEYLFHQIRKKIEYKSTFNKIEIEVL